jgi:hypothetical protein
MRAMIVVLVASIAWMSAAAESSVLANTAAALKPGSWAELKTEGFTKEMTVTSKQYSIFGWTDDGAWDAQTNQFLFMGFRQELKFIAYSEQTNSWRIIPSFEWPLKDAFGHPYGNNAIDAAKGIYYTHPCGTTLIYAYDLRKNEWSKLPPCDLKCLGLGLCIEFFPEMNALIFIYQKQAYKFDFATQKWSVLHKDLPCGDIHVMLRHNAKTKCMLVAGGNRGDNKVAKIDAAGKLTALKDAPFELNVNHTKIVADPSTGDFLVVSKENFYAFDAEADKWTSLGTLSKDTPLRDPGSVCAAIDKYGVTMWVEGYTSKRQVWLYRHHRAAGK